MQRSGRAVRAEPPPWLRGPARYADGWIELDSGRAEEYHPMEEVDLLYDLAAIQRPDEAVAFARRYGLLRHGRDGCEHREQFGKWQDVATVLTGLLVATRTLREAIEGDPDARADLWSRFEPITGKHFGARVTPGSDGELFDQVSKWVAWGVNEGLEGVEVQLRAASDLLPASGGSAPGPPGLFLFSPRPKDLVGYAYHQLALALANRVPMHECPACRRFFVVADRRQNYCSPTCAGRVRYRRWAERKRGRVQGAPQVADAGLAK